jgi:hypothetical protein
MEHTQQSLIAEIEKFIADHGMAESTFGRKVVGDWRLLSDLRKGRELRSRTVARVREFMATSDSQAAQAA